MVLKQSTYSLEVMLHRVNYSQLVSLLLLVLREQVTYPSMVFLILVDTLDTSSLKVSGEDSVLFLSERDRNFLKVDQIGIGQSGIGVFNFKDAFEVNGVAKIKDLFVSGIVARI